MALVSRTPFDDALLTLQAALDRLLGSPTPGLDLGPSDSSVFPPINIFAQSDALVVRAEVPGVRPQDLQVDIELRRLSIRGERPAEDRKNGSYHRRERQYGSFSRIVQLPEDLDPTKATAQCKNGMLTVRIPKTEEAKPRRIDVRAA